MFAASGSTSEKDHVDYLDGWRGLAIVMLLWGHFFPVPGINLGVLGVNLFFVLSGLLMGRLLFIRQTPLPTFYRRRISRIVPAHLLFIGLVPVWFAISGQTINWTESLAALFFIKNYITGDIGHTVMPFGHIWSLSVEEHSYIALSLVALAVRQRWVSALKAVGVLTACLSLAGFWYASHYAANELEFSKWIRSEVSAYGIFVSALVLLTLQRLPALRVPAVLCSLMFVTAVALHWWSVPLPVKTTVGVGLLALVVNLLPQAPAAFVRLLSLRPLRTLGLWSFSIYLWQQPFYVASHNGQLSPMLALLLAILGGVASFHLLERPVRHFLNARWGQSSGAASANAAGGLHKPS
ncbi:acyltransferase [Viridibacterium curvum]|uniref:Acyltransferase n=1 Tax=Viridibacterium curvum TaxID=1101404 RepID=A0ABP9QP24_9RHOO